MLGVNNTGRIPVRKRQTTRNQVVKRQKTEESKVDTSSNPEQASGLPSDLNTIPHPHCIFPQGEDVGSLIELLNQDKTEIIENIANYVVHILELHEKLVISADDDSRNALKVFNELEPELKSRVINVWGMNGKAKAFSLIANQNGSALVETLLEMPEKNELVLPGIFELSEENPVETVELFDRMRESNSSKTKELLRGMAKKNSHGFINFFRSLANNLEDKSNDTHGYKNRTMKVKELIKCAFDPSEIILLKTSNKVRRPNSFSNKELGIVLGELVA